VATAIKDSTRIDNHAGRMHFSGYYTLGLNLYAALRKNHAVESAGDYDPVSFDLSFDSRALAENDGLLGDDVALDVPIDAEGALELKRAL
jgi:hypothetical protein